MRKGGKGGVEKKREKEEEDKKGEKRKKRNRSPIRVLSGSFNLFELARAKGRRVGLVGATPNTQRGENEKYPLLEDDTSRRNFER